MQRQKALEHLGVGRITALCLFAGREIELFKQRSRKLLGRIDVELIAHIVIDRLLQLSCLCAELLSVSAYALYIDGKSEIFHPREDSRQGYLDLIQELVVSDLMDIVGKPSAQSGQSVDVSITLKAVLTYRHGYAVLGAQAVESIARRRRAEQIGGERGVEGDIRVYALFVTVSENRLTVVGVELFAAAQYLFYFFYRTNDI